MDLLSLQVSTFTIGTTIDVLKDLYSDFRITLHNEIVYLHKDATNHKSSGIFNLRISPSTTGNFIQTHTNRIERIKVLLNRRNNLINSYNSLYFAKFKKNDNRFKSDIKREAVDLISLVNKLESILDFNFHFPEIQEE